MKDIDAHALEAALKAAGGSATLAELRDKSDLMPEPVLRTVMRWPERFAALDTIRRGHVSVLISLGPELPPADKAFLNAVRGAGENGIARVRLWQKRSISAGEADALAAKYVEYVRVEVRERKTFFIWKAPGAVKVEPLPEPDEFHGRLVALIGSGHRHLSWLRQQFGAVVDTVLAEHAAEFELEPVNWGETEATADMVVRLRAESDQVAIMEPVSLPPASGVQEPVREVVAAAELEELKWKPASPDCGRRRNGPVVAKNMGNKASKGNVDGGYGVSIRR